MTVDALRNASKVSQKFDTTKTLKWDGTFSSSSFTKCGTLSKLTNAMLFCISLCPINPDILPSCPKTCCLILLYSVIACDDMSNSKVSCTKVGGCRNVYTCLYDFARMNGISNDSSGF